MRISKLKSKFIPVLIAALCIWIASGKLSYATDPDLSGEILFYSDQSGLGQLYMLDLSNDDIRQIGKSGSRADHFPGWSADGEKIVFESYRADGWHPWVMNADGKNARRVSDFPAYNTSYYEFDPSFAPDNQTIIFTRQFKIYKVTLDNKKPQLIGDEKSNLRKSSPSFSPDMNHIVFDGHQPRGEFSHIYRMNADGNDITKLTQGNSQNLSPIWSPSGNKILFYSNRDGSYELYEMKATGEAPRRVLNPDIAKTAGFKPAAFIDPWNNDNGATEQYRASYSPDENWIAFSRDIDGNRELFATNIEGTIIKRLTTRGGHDGFPEWRPRPVE